MCAATAQVRVINNVKKLQEVKPNFQEAFKQDGYPSTLPYQQKVPSSSHSAIGCCQALWVSIVNTRDVDTGQCAQSPSFTAALVSVAAQGVCHCTF